MFVEVGTQQQPARSAEPVKVARDLLRSHFRTPEGAPGLWHVRGFFYRWEGYRWSRYEPSEMKATMWRLLEDFHFMDEKADGTPICKRFKPDHHKIRDVLEALEAICLLGKLEIPCWLRTVAGVSGRFDPEYTVGFEDQVIGVRGGHLEVAPRTDAWFDTAIVPVEWDPQATCPLWKKTLQEWSQGDEKWQSLLQRWFGYTLFKNRRHAKILLMQGRARSGKGTITKVLDSLLGETAYIGTSLYSLANRFGMEGISECRCLCVNEVANLDNYAGERAAQVLKTILGQDRIDIDRKGLPILRNVRIPAAPILVSNPIPRLPNEGEGISSKMLILPFVKSYRTEPNLSLIDQLLEELPGIARWAIEGALALEAEERPSRRWPLPEGAEEKMTLYLHENNPFDAFLMARFLPEQEAFVSSEALWKEWLDWRSTNRVFRRDITRNNLAVRIEQESSWELRRSRPHGQSRGLKGLVFRESADDEL